VSALRKIKEEMDLMSTAHLLTLPTLRPDQPFHCLRILRSRYTVFAVIGQSNQTLGVFVRFSAVLAAWLLCGAAAAQGMYKCKDASGKITYSGNECEMIGLISAGEVKGKANVAPAYKPPPGSRAKPGAGTRPPAKPATAASQGSAKKEEAAAPERRCFVVKTAKGSFTRCNDVPPDEPPASR